MASTKNALDEVSLNVDESMGLRRGPHTATLSPVSSAKDIGRRPLRTFGKVEIDRVIPDPEQPRTHFDDADIERLANSIRKHGQLHPIRVRWNESGHKWLIVSGERRWRAPKAAGLPTIDCFFVDGKMSEPEIREQQLVENLLRTDLNPIEEARAYQSLMKLCDWNGKQVAESLNVTTSRVSRALALLDLPEDVQKKVESGTLAKSSAYEISKLSDTEAQAEIATKASTGELSHANTVKKINERRSKKKPARSTGTNLSFFAENGIKVAVASKSKVDYHEIELALTDAIEEVQHRIRNNIKLF